MRITPATPRTPAPIPQFKFVRHAQRGYVAIAPGHRMHVERRGNRWVAWVRGQQSLPMRTRTGACLALIARPEAPQPTAK